MDELRERLEEKGARFFAEIGDSAEVVESGLLDADAAPRKEPIPGLGSDRCYL